MKAITFYGILYAIIKDKTIVMAIAILIEAIKIILILGIIYHFFKISDHVTNLERGQDVILDKLETLEYQCANINNNLHSILEELQILNDKTPYPENEEEKYNINNQQYRPNSGINDFKLYDNNR